MSEEIKKKTYLKPGEVKPGVLKTPAIVNVKEGPEGKVIEDRCLSCNKIKHKGDLGFDAKIHCEHGRPTKYTQELLKACEAYLALSMPNKATDEVIHSIEGLCDFEGVDISTETAYEWVKDPEKGAFSDIMVRVMRKQGKRLLNKGVDNTFSGRIVTLLLAKHGYRNQVDNFTREIPVDPAAQAAGDAAIADYLKNKK